MSLWHKRAGVSNNSTSSVELCWQEREEGEANQNTVTLREVNVPLKTVDQCGEDFENYIGAVDHLTKLRTTHRIKSFFICSDTTVDTHRIYRLQRHLPSSQVCCLVLYELGSEVI